MLWVLLTSNRQILSDVTVLRNMTILVLLTLNLTSIDSRNSVGVPLSSSVEDLIRTLPLYPQCFEYLSLRCIISCSIHLNHPKPLFHSTVLLDTMFPERRALSPVVKICLVFTPPCVAISVCLTMIWLSALLFRVPFFLP